MIDLDKSLTQRLLYLIFAGASSNHLARAHQLKSAAADRGLDSVLIDSETIDYRSLPMLEPGDMLFNCSRGSARLETLLMRPGVATLRTGPSMWVANIDDTTIYTAVHDRLALPGPKTIHHLPDDRERLLDYVNFVNGPPVILKAAGSTRGEGVILCRDMPSLLSAAEAFRSQGREFILREFIPTDHVLRVVVLAGRVLCALRHPIRPSDFRSTIDGTYTMVDQPSAVVVDLALRAMQACEHAFGGVDIIEHSVRGPLLLEANPPCNFASIKQKTGIDIAGPLIDVLLERSRQIRPMN